MLYNDGDDELSLSVAVCREGIEITARGPGDTGKVEGGLFKWEEIIEEMFSVAENEVLEQMALGGIYRPKDGF